MALTLADAAAALEGMNTEQSELLSVSADSAVEEEGAAVFADLLRLLVDAPESQVAVCFVARLFLLHDKSYSPPAAPLIRELLTTIVRLARQVSLTMPYGAFASSPSLALALSVCLNALSTEQGARLFIGDSSDSVSLEEDAVTICLQVLTHSSYGAKLMAGGLLYNICLALPPSDGDLSESVVQILCGLMELATTESNADVLSRMLRTLCLLLRKQPSAGALARDLGFADSLSGLTRAVHRADRPALEEVCRALRPS
jgi:hypothetical protein